MGCGCFEVVVDSDRLGTTTSKWLCGCVVVVVVAVVFCDDYFLASERELLCVLELKRTVLCHQRRHVGRRGCRMISEEEGNKRLTPSSFWEIGELCACLLLLRVSSVSTSTTSLRLRWKDKCCLESWGEIQSFESHEAIFDRFSRFLGEFCLFLLMLRCSLALHQV
jgi:hypothetical protein